MNIVVLSYNVYAELWGLIYNNIKTFFPKSNVFIFTDFIPKEYDTTNADIKIIESGVKQWSKSTFICTEELKQKYGVSEALYTFDDLFITKVNTIEVEKAYNLIKQKTNIASIKLSNTHLGKINYNEHFKYVKKGKYFTTSVFSFWKLEQLQKILKVKEFSPWEFEVMGYKYAKDLKILSLKKEAINYKNIIVKGKKVRNSNIEINSFDVMSYKEYLTYSLKLNLVKIKNKMF